MEAGNEEEERSPATTLQEAEYAPVWTSDLGYPGDIPDEIAEYLDPGVEQGRFIVGSLSSIFWLKKVEVLNELIFDPGHKLEDEVYKIPHGGTWFWLIEALFDQNKIPKRYMNLVSWESSTKPCSDFVRPPFPSNILGATLKWNRKRATFAEGIESLLGDLKMVESYTKRSHKGFISLTTLFYPIITNSHMNNEFGPGFYASPSLETAITYCLPNSALLIFDDPENLSRYTLRGEEWDTIVLYWTGLQVGNLDDRVPPQWRGVDIIEGQSHEEPQSRMAQEWREMKSREWGSRMPRSRNSDPL
ncbi:hypothetical protein N7481_006444 [Penicillium waksmanii]|uniref:uncharacterized protein n=1 Tax=Penicillium waksmanii TaxID=69791 RepID=UPI00254776CA|nr:uncharacterized protein N7481_006444 [Penicillium waksmanii]KAJ5984345.1 hypothetical protein N7481_006444 [Penicillium waksmanii]